MKRYASFIVLAIVANLAISAPAKKVVEHEQQIASTQPLMTEMFLRFYSSGSICSKVFSRPLASILKRVLYPTIGPSFPIYDPEFDGDRDDEYRRKDLYFNNERVKWTFKPNAEDSYWMAARQKVKTDTSINIDNLHFAYSCANEFAAAADRVINLVNNNALITYKVTQLLIDDEINKMAPSFKRFGRFSYVVAPDGSYVNFLQVTNEGKMILSVSNAGIKVLNSNVILLDETHLRGRQINILTNTKGSVQISQ